MSALGVSLLLAGVFARAVVNQAQLIRAHWNRITSAETIRTRQPLVPAIDR